ncbi:MAG: flagellar biosynthesis repressor FlbT [Gemmatimonadota bacterium]
MGLRITVKPGERLILGGAVVRNGATRAELIIENDVPILRGKDVMRLEDAESPCRRIYFTIQLMYVDPANMDQHRELYLELVSDVVHASPSTRATLSEISDLVVGGQYYQALKVARKLIAYEEELISHVAIRS